MNVVLMGACNNSSLTCSSLGYMLLTMIMPNVCWTFPCRTTSSVSIASRTQTYIDHALINSHVFNESEELNASIQVSRVKCGTHRRHGSRDHGESDEGSAWMNYTRCSGVLCDMTRPENLKGKVNKTVVRPNVPENNRETSQMVWTCYREGG